MKLLNDTIKVNGRYSQKRIMIYLSFIFATLYGFLPFFMPKFEVKEFVFLGFLGMGGFTLYRNQKINQNNEKSTTELYGPRD
jgi:hypothetical protein